ncbi:MAG: hypothetical protein E5X43_06550 [Mesorhizobium sp.]|nr:MAG: hypothetical protein E5X43_06550 [Mesorhizobium sp.]
MGLIGLLGLAGLTGRRRRDDTLRWTNVRNELRRERRVPLRRPRPMSRSASDVRC